MLYYLDLEDILINCSQRYPYLNYI